MIWLASLLFAANKTQIRGELVKNRSGGFHRFQPPRTHTAAGRLEATTTRLQVFAPRTRRRFAERTTTFVDLMSLSARLLRARHGIHLARRRSRGLWICRPDG